MKQLQVLLYLCCILNTVIYLHAHPNCVEPVGGSYFPPKPDPPLRYCEEYSNDIDGACCTVETEMTFAGNIVPNMVDEGSACYPFVKKMFCTYCAPYAGHFYESEGNIQARPYSWMCKKFCERLWDNCADTMLDADAPGRMGQMNRFPGLENGMGVTSLSRLFGSKEEYCGQYTTDNPVSCYSDDPKEKEVSFDGPGVPYNVYRAFPNINFLTMPNTRNLPLHITHMLGLNDGSDKIVVVFQHGVVLSFENSISVTDYDVILDIQDEVYYDGGGGSEYGFHGIGIHPNFKDNGWIYAKYSHLAHQNQVARHTISQTTGIADPAAKQIILSYETYGIMHHGGQPVFGNDGYLYIPVGDGTNYFSNFVEYNPARDPQSLLGKVLRLDVDQSTAADPYRIPPDNPFVDDPNWLPEIYAYGLRNPWRFSYDSVTNRFWYGDVGQFAYESIKIVERGKFHGWHSREGYNCYYPITSSYGNGHLDCVTPGEVLPVLEFPHFLSAEFCEVESDPPHCQWQIQGSAVIGGWVYRGSRNPSLTGAYLFSNFEPATAAKLYVMQYNVENPFQVSQVFRMELTNDAFTEFRIPTLGTDAGGEVYVINYDNPNEIWALEEESNQTPRPTPSVGNRPVHKTPEDTSSPAVGNNPVVGSPSSPSPSSPSGVEVRYSFSYISLISMILISLFWHQHG